MILGFFSGTKKFGFECPICSRPYSIKLNPADFTAQDYEYREEASVIDHIKCGFCPCQMTVVIFKSGRVKAYDDKWEKVKRRYEMKIDEVDTALMELDEDAKSSTIAALEKKMEKLENEFDNKESAYFERQENWRDKYEEKYS